MKFDKFGKLGQLKMPDLKNSVGKLKERWKSQPGKTKKLVAAIGGGILCTAVLMAVVVGARRFSSSSRIHAAFCI